MITALFFKRTCLRIFVIKSDFGTKATKTVKTIFAQSLTVIALPIIATLIIPL